MAMNIRTLFVTSALWACACIPLPITHTAQVTPKIKGVLKYSDGTPVVGAAIGVSDKAQDTTCTRFGARDTTDDSGRFRLPAMKVRRRIFWLSMMETFGMTGYRLCAQATDPQARTSRLLGTSVAGMVSGDSLNCLQWGTPPAEKLTCESWVPVTTHFRRKDDPSVRVVASRIVEGGSWTSAGKNGRYRILLADAPERWGKHLFLEWIDTSSAPGPGRVLARAPLSAAEPMGGRAPIFVEQNGQWYAAAIANKIGAFGNERPYVFELGPPGTVRLLPDSTRKRLFPLSPRVY